MPIPGRGFIDIDGSTFEIDIAWLAESGITRGCADAERYCPNAAVTRGQMASFLSRALDQSVDVDGLLQR